MILPSPRTSVLVLAGQRLHVGIGDYDCEGGSGNGPNYVAGPIRVLPPDPFGLDGNHDGWGCTS